MSFLCGFFVSLGFVLLICCLLAFLRLILYLFGRLCGLSKLSGATLCSLWSFGGSVVFMPALVFCYRLAFLAVFILLASVLTSFQCSFADGSLVSLVTLSLVRLSFHPFWSHFKSLSGCFASCTSALQVRLTPYLPSGPAPLDSYIT